MRKWIILCILFSFLGVNLAGCHNKTADVATKISQSSPVSETKQEMLTKEYAEAKQYSDSRPIKGEYDDDRVLVSLMHDISIQGFDFYPEDFAGIGNIKSVESIMKLEPGEFEARSNKLTNYDEFHQILVIYLNEPGIEKVEQMKTELYKLPFVESVGFNFYDRAD